MKVARHLSDDLYTVSTEDLKQLYRRVAANNFSPAFQGRVRNQKSSGVTSATHERLGRFKRR